MKTMPLLLAAVTLLAATLPTVSAGASEERFLIVKEYRYLPGDTAGNQDVGMSLCATRCNAMSSDYLNYTEPGGWRVIMVAADKEMPVPLDNPFLGGSCICVADEYVVKADELNNPLTWKDPTRQDNNVQRQPLKD